MENHFQICRYNDDSVLIGKCLESEIPSTSKPGSFQAKQISQMLNFGPEKTINMSESSSSDEAEVSSNADSDFIDVPEMDSEMDNDDTFFMRSKFPLPPPFLMNPPPDGQNGSTDTKLEVVINPGQMCTIQDDIFADIFVKPDHEEAKSIENKMEVVDEGNQPDEECVAIEVKNIENIETVEIIEDDEEEFVEVKEIKKLETQTKLPEPNEAEALQIPEPAKIAADSKIQSILSGLDNQISAVTKLSLDDILGPSSSDVSSTTTNKETEFLETLKEKESTSNGFTTPTKIPQPFFVKKTPPSSKKKSPAEKKNESEVSPSKAIKSLAEVFDNIPSTSTNIISEKDSIEMAANVLRENKSKKELENIAEHLHQERRDLAAERNKKDRLGVSITEQMSMECMDLLRLFGVPYVVAPMEAEAQCAYLNEINLTDGTITDDSDIWLFGGRTVYKNFFDQNKHVLEYKSDNIHKLFHLDRHKLIQLSFLVGSDYTEGKFCFIFECVWNS